MNLVEKSFLFSPNNFHINALNKSEGFSFLNKLWCKTYFPCPKSFRQNEVLSDNNDFFLGRIGTLQKGLTSEKKKASFNQKKKKICNMNIPVGLPFIHYQVRNWIIREISLTICYIDLGENSFNFFFDERLAVFMSNKSIEKRKLPLFCLTVT